MRRPALLAAVLGAAVALFARRAKARRAEQDLWHEASLEAPDLR